jgi:hypothetical protein
VPVVARRDAAAGFTVQASAMSDLVLKLIAIRLAALVMAGLVIRALPERPVDTICVPRASVVRHATAPDIARPRDGASDDLGDMRLHD